MPVLCSTEVKQLSRILWNNAIDVLLVAPCHQLVVAVNENCDATAAPTAGVMGGLASVRLCCITTTADATADAMTKSTKILAV